MTNSKLVDTKWASFWQTFLDEKKQRNYMIICSDFTDSVECNTVGAEEDTALGFKQVSPIPAPFHLPKKTKLEHFLLAPMPPAETLGCNSDFT